MRTLYFMFLIVLFSGFLLTHCAGTRGNEEEATSQEASQEDLDDIEKLLGISTNKEEQAQPKQQDQKQKQSSEKLDLLDTEIQQKESNSSASAYQAAAMQQAEQSKPQNNQDIQKLNKQIQKKDDEIANLKAKLVSQDNEIQRLMTQKSSSPVYASTGPVTDVAPEEYQSRYDEARSAFEARNYSQALQLFESLLASSTSMSLSDNAQYWIGESHYALKQYDAAIIAFEKVFTFPNSNKKPDAQFKLGVCYARKGDKAKALEEFNRLKEDYPNSEYVAKAEKVIAKL